MQATIDRISTSDLPGRYNIGKTQVSNRRKALGIEAQKEGKEYFITADDLLRLDALHEHLCRGGTIETFGLFNASSEPDKSSTGLDLAPVVNWLTEPSELMQLFLQLLPIVRQSLPAAQPLAPQEAIDRACEKGWLLSTSQLCELLGVRSIHGQTIDRYGFRFTRCGRNGREGAWAIEKLER